MLLGGTLALPPFGIEVSRMMNRQIVHERRMATLKKQSPLQSALPDWEELRGAVDVNGYAPEVSPGLDGEVSIGGSAPWIKARAAGTTSF